MEKKDKLIASKSGGAMKHGENKYVIAIKGVGTVIGIAFVIWLVGWIKIDPWGFVTWLISH